MINLYSAYSAKPFEIQYLGKCGTQ